MLNFDLLLKIQVGLFGNFDSISTTPKVISEIFNLYKDKNFIPSTFNELDVLTGQTKTRILMRNVDKNISILFGTKKIDFLQEISSFNNSNQINIELFYSEIKELIVLFSKFDNYKFNRLSTVQEHIANNLDKKIKNELFKKTITQSLSDEQNLEDWAIRISKTDIFKAKKLNEICMFETIMGKMGINNTEITDLDGFKLFIDINTDEMNTHEIFDFEDISSFIDISSKRCTELVIKFKNLI